MEKRVIGKTGLEVSPLGFGAFKIGRNEKIKYAAGYDLPSDAETEVLLNAVLDLGINLIDTAPAYGISEERIGQFISGRRDEYVLSSKVGETFADGESTYGFDREHVVASVERSLKRLRTDVIDLLFIHSDGHDMKILNETDIVETLQDLKAKGDVKFVGMSGKSVEGAMASMAWADVLMVEYHLEDQSHECVLEAAANEGVGVVVKKGLASGVLAPGEAIEFILKRPEVASIVVGGLNLDHIKSNLNAAMGLK